VAAGSEPDQTNIFGVVHQLAALAADGHEDEFHLGRGAGPRDCFLRGLLMEENLWRALMLSRG
jgi:hypothetical protein